MVRANFLAGGAYEQLVPLEGRVRLLDPAVDGRLALFFHHFHPALARENRTRFRQFCIRLYRREKYGEDYNEIY
ncbi:MAG TPA: hypothetical protein VJR26_02365 [Candidatus Acidoferrales bacterium]|nr:hypothetical protein [Candidatus Acidoferrales bacterium]